MEIRLIICMVMASVALLSVAACTYKDTVRSSFIGASKFREIGSNLYVSHEIGSEKDREILKLISDARTRVIACLLYTSPSPRDGLLSRMPSSA